MIQSFDPAGQINQINTDIRNACGSEILRRDSNMSELPIPGDNTPSPATSDYLANYAEMLVGLEMVDSPPEEAFDKYTRLVARTLAAPVALVSVVEEGKDRQYFKSSFGLKGIWALQRQTPLSHSFCQFVKRDNRPLIVTNAPKDARICDNMAIPDLGVRAYLGVPFHDRNRHAMGALCAIDSNPRDWTQDDIDTITDLAACVTDQVCLRMALRLSNNW